jgi:hypothetical protein
MSQAGVAEHMQTVKYPAARAAIALLKDAGLRVLHVGSPAFDPWRPAGPTVPHIIKRLYGQAHTPCSTHLSTN